MRTYSAEHVHPLHWECARLSLTMRTRLANQGRLDLTWVQNPLICRAQGRIVLSMSSQEREAANTASEHTCDQDDATEELCGGDGAPCTSPEDDLEDADPTVADDEVSRPGPVSNADCGHENTLEYLYPAFALKITLRDLELRLIRDDDFPAYAQLLRDQIFQPEFTDATFPWANQEPDDRVRSAFRYQWTVRASLDQYSWALPFGVFHEGTLIGSQEINAQNFDLTRTVGTGSWLTRGQQGKGHGKLMRQAVLEFVFDYLKAERAESDALETNLPSLGVSRSLGYRDNGTDIRMHGGKACRFHRVVLTPEDFVRPEERITVEGLTPTLIEDLGAG